MSHEILQIAKTALMETLANLAEREAELSASKRAMLVMNRILKLRGSASAAILHYAYEVKRDNIFVDEDFNDQEFGLWLDQVIDRGTRYTLHATTHTFATSMGPWLDTSSVTCPITHRDVTPMYLLEKAGYSKVMDVRATWEKLAREEDQLGMGKIITLILSKSRADIDRELKDEGLRESKAASVPDGLWNKPYAFLFDSSGKDSHSVVIGNLTLDQAEYLVSHPLRKFVSLSPSQPDDLLRPPATKEKEVFITQPELVT